MKTTFVLILALLMQLGVYAQVEFQSKLSRDKVGLNERITIEFFMNVDGNNFKRPDFEGFRIVAGPSQSYSQQWINGKGTFRKGFTYVIEPTRKGVLSIGPASMDYEGKSYSTQNHGVTVTDAVQRPGEQNFQSDVLLVAEVSNASPFLNEGIRVVYKIYVGESTGLRGWSQVESPTFADFWSQNIDNRNDRVRNGQYNGKDYRYMVLRESILYPQKTGEVIIEPLTLNVTVEIPTNKVDFFGRRQFRTSEEVVSSGTQKLIVKPLPDEGKPVDFTGAVGKFQFDVTNDLAAVQAGESIKTKVSVTGNGNLKLLQLPKLEVPKGLELYEPERIDEVKTTINGMSGAISDSYVIVPQHGGSFVIPPVSFSYFNPDTEKYERLYSAENLIEVDGPAPVVSLTEEQQDAAHKVEVEKTFAYIKTATELIPQKKKSFFNTSVFWGTIGVPILLIPIAILLRRRKESRELDVTGKRLRKANKLSKKYLSAAKKSIGNREAFYIALEKSLHNYLKAKLSIETSEMSKERISQLLADRKVSQETIMQLINLLQAGEFARYAPSGDATMSKDYEQAAAVLNSLDKQLKA